MNQHLNRAFPIVAAALGNKFGVNVVVGGVDAKTDGKTITLPGYNLDDPFYKDIAWGYLAHEASHIRHTDFGCFAQSASSPIRKDILNMLEDVRIEKAMIGLFPGTKNTILAMDESICLGGHYGLATAQSHPAAVLSQFLFLRLAVDVLGFTSLAGLAGQIEEVLEHVFPAGAVTRLFGLLADVPWLQSTHEALVLTDRILRMIEEERNKEAEQARQQQTADNQAGGAGNQTETEDKAQDEEEDADDSPNSEEDELASDVDADDSPNSEEDDLAPDVDADNTPDSEEEDSASENDAEPMDVDPSPDDAGAEPTQGAASSVDILSQVLDATEEDLPEDIADIARAILAEQPRHSYDAQIRIPLAVTPVKHPDGHRLVQSVLAESGKIRASLQSLVQAETKDKVMTKSHGRKVVGNKLARLAVGNPNVFEHRTLARKPSTAVHILADFSGSMGKKIGTKSLVEIALEASVALALAFESISGVNPAITRFPYQDTENVVPLLRHGQKVRPIAGNFAALADGSRTPLHAALWYTAAAVLATKEERKVIIVVTDGDPDSRASASAIIERCQHSGIELIGIGIGVTVSHLFDIAIRVDDVSQLRAELFRIGRQLLAA